MVFKNGVKNIQAAGYNGARTVITTEPQLSDLIAIFPSVSYFINIFLDITAEQEMALGKIITWTYEPKSAEVRKAAMASLVSLFRLNANHFSMILHRLPKVNYPYILAFIRLNLNCLNGS